MYYRKCHCQPRPNFSKIFIFEDDKNIIVILDLENYKLLIYILLVYKTRTICIKINHLISISIKKYYNKNLFN